MYYGTIHTILCKVAEEMEDMEKEKGQEGERKVERLLPHSIWDGSMPMILTSDYRATSDQM